MKKLQAIEENKQGHVTGFNLHATESNVDWIQAGRLTEQAKAGNKTAAKKLKEMDATEMVFFTFEELESIRISVELEQQ
jgi:YD repeat-containing protein